MTVVYNNGVKIKMRTKTVLSTKAVGNYEELFKTLDHADRPILRKNEMIDKFYEPIEYLSALIKIFSDLENNLKDWTYYFGINDPILDIINEDTESFREAQVKVYEALRRQIVDIYDRCDDIVNEISREVNQ